MLRLRLVCLLTLLLIASCTPSAGPNAPQSLETAWGPAYAIASAEQVSAPALAVDGARVFAGWIGSDTRGVHHDARVLAPGLTAESVTLPLPPVYPYAQQAYSSLAGNVHLLWLDANKAGVTELYSALISPALTVERGPTPIAADVNARRYAALPVGDGALSVLWSGASLAEPSLFLSRIDLAGRPALRTHLTDNADYPALLRTHDGQVYAFWLNTTDKRFYTASLQEATAFSPVRLAYGPDLGVTDRLLGVYAAADTAYQYLFWTIQRADGQFDSWVMTAPTLTGEWTAPRQVRLQHEASANPYETGFNSGPAQVAAWGETPISHVMPLSSPSDRLPVAGLWAGQVGLIYFQAGEIVAAQTIAPANPLAAPALAVDQSRFLYLAWAQPDANAPASLLLTTLQPLGAETPQ
jgi:hypothetical protein